MWKMTWACEDTGKNALSLQLEASSGRLTYKLGAARGNVTATMLLRTMIAAMALAAYFWYVSII